MTFILIARLKGSQNECKRRSGMRLRKEYDIPPYAHPSESFWEELLESQPEVDMYSGEWP